MSFVSGRDIIAVKMLIPTSPNAGSVTRCAVAAFGIYNVLGIVISQKRREIAILRAVGYTPAQVERLFVLQGLLLGAGGAAIGLVLGFGVSLAFNGMKWPMIGHLYVSFAPWIYGLGLLISVSAALVASYLPARAARRMTPVDILRTEA